MLRAVLVGSGSSGSSFLLIARDLLYYGLVAAWHRLRRSLAPRPPPCLPLPAAESLDGESLVSVVIPAFNEAGSIGEVVRTALRDANVEVIVADGGSRDGTQEQARAAGARALQPFGEAPSWQGHSSLPWPPPTHPIGAELPRALPERRSWAAQFTTRDCAAALSACNACSATA